MQLQDLRVALIREVSGRKKFSVSQTKNLQHKFRQYEELVLKAANFSSELLEKEFPLMEAKLRAHENILKSLDGLYFTDCDPKKVTLKEVRSRTEKLDLEGIMGDSKNKKNSKVDNKI
jgi:hypothetical protein